MGLLDDSEKLAGSEGHLRGMAVVPEWQGRNVAAALLQSAESQLTALGCDRITLDTTAPLRRAIRFYESSGYESTGVVLDFFGIELFEYRKRVGER